MLIGLDFFWEISTYKKMAIRFLILASMIFFSGLLAEELPTTPSVEAQQKHQAEEDAYLEGYIQGLVTSHYYEFDILVYVENGDVYLYNLPRNDLLRESIINFVCDLPEVISVTEVCKFPERKLKKLEQREVMPQVRGVWFPQQTVLYPPMIANPMAPIYSASYRIGDNIFGTKTIAISLGDNFPIFRWRDVFYWQGALQFDIQSGIWSVFEVGVDHGDEFAELKNTDYLLGFPLSYVVGKWAYRLRIYHISTHLGDEFMKYHPEVERVNPSMEAVDFFFSCQVNKDLRLYIGPGFVLHSDSSFHIDPFYFEYGGEWRFWGVRSTFHRLYGTFFAALYFRNWQENHWRLDGTYMLGYEWSKMQGVGRKLRLFVDYHHGYGEGQFFKQRTSYTEFGFAWGF